MSNFYFTVTDLGRFIGKSPVTLRTWERQGLISLPRDQSGDRKLSVEDVRAAARRAKELGRINEQRLNIVEAAVTILSLVEKENQ